MLTITDGIVDTGSPHLRGDYRDGRLRLVLDNQPKLNALSLEMLQALTRVGSQLRDDPSVRVVTLTGAGDRAFASGADLNSLPGASVESSSADVATVYAEALSAVLALPQPTIAVVRGFCLGGGLALALCADIRICDDTAEFGIPAARIGLGYPDVQPLVQAVGAAWAAEILFTARRLSSGEALQAGLVNRVVAAADLTSCADEVATTIAANAPLSVAAAKVALREYRKDGSERSDAEIARAAAACASSEDYIEGRRAMAERRKPIFRGR